MFLNLFWVEKYSPQSCWFPCRKRCIPTVSNGFRDGITARGVFFWEVLKAAHNEAMAANAAGDREEARIEDIWTVM